MKPVTCLKINALQCTMSYVNHYLMDTAMNDTFCKFSYALVLLAGIIHLKMVAVLWTWFQNKLA